MKLLTKLRASRSCVLSSASGMNANKFIIQNANAFLAEKAHYERMPQNTIRKTCILLVLKQKISSILENCN